MVPSRENELQTPLPLALAYLAFGTVWILVTDLVVSGAWSIQTLKGLGFVLGSALFIYAVGEALRRRRWSVETRFRRLFENAPLGIAILDAEGHPLRVNRALERFLGFDEETLRGMVFTDFTYPEDVDRDRGLYKELVEGKRDVYTIEKRYVRPDGQVVWGRLAVTAVRGREGRLHQIIGMVEDIDETKRVEADLRMKSEALENALNGYDIVDAEGRLVYANRAYLDMWGYASLAEILGTSPAAHCVDPEMPKRMKETLDKRGQGLFRFVARRKDGSTFEALMAARRSPGPDGAHVYHGSSIDLTSISERKRVEAELDRQLRLSELVLQSVSDGVFAWDLELNCTLFSPRMEVLAGVPEEDALGRPVTAAWSSLGADGAEHHLRAALEGQEILQNDLAYRTSPDSEVRVCEARYGPVRDGAGRIIGGVCVVRDVTDRRDLELQLRLAQKMEAVGQLAGGVAHDFNNLLQVIHGYSEMALEGLGPEADARADVAQIVQAANKAGVLVGQLLAFSRRQILQPEPLEIDEIVADTLKMLRRLIGEQIRLEFSPGFEAGCVHADRGMLEQVLMNLCINARDAMPDGGTLRIGTASAFLDEDFCAHHEWARPGRFARLYVEDTGTGMDAHTKQRVFEPFFTTKGPGRGTGLGLATVYGIVQQHEGLISLDSELGEGTRFEVFLPTVDLAPDGLDATRTGPLPGGEESILVAEDDAQVRQLTEVVLRSAGYRVRTAASGPEAVEHFAADPRAYDLLILDVIMPDLGGREAAERARELRPELPVLFMSGYSDDAIQTEWLASAEVRLLRKPFSRPDLLRAVREVLDRA